MYSMSGSARVAVDTWSCNGGGCNVIRDRVRLLRLSSVLLWADVWCKQIMLERREKRGIRCVFISFL